MKRYLKAAAAATLWLLGPADTAFAHHSFAAEYDASKPVNLKGTLTRIEWTNPHGWLYIDVKDAKGRVTNWAVESGAPNALIRRGLRKTDFPLGSVLVIKGFQAKSGKAVANAISVTFNDGRNFWVGSSGSGVPQPPK